MLSLINIMNPRLKSTRYQDIFVEMSSFCQFLMIYAPKWRGIHGQFEFTWLNISEELFQNWERISNSNESFVNLSKRSIQRQDLAYFLLTPPFHHLRHLDLNSDKVLSKYCRLLNFRPIFFIFGSKNLYFQADFEFVIKSCNFLMNPLSFCLKLIKLGQKLTKTELISTNMWISIVVPLINNNFCQNSLSNMNPFRITNTGSAMSKWF